MHRPCLVRPRRDVNCRPLAVLSSGAGSRPLLCTTAHASDRQTILFSLVVTHVRPQTINTIIGFDAAFYRRQARPFWTGESVSQFNYGRLELSSFDKHYALSQTTKVQNFSFFCYCAIFSLDRQFSLSRMIV